MENKKKELDFEGLEIITGGTSEESKELMEFINKYYSDPKTGERPNHANVLRENGIVCVCSDNLARNTYVYEDGYRIKHEELMRRLRKRIEER